MGGGQRSGAGESPATTQVQVDRLSVCQGLMFAEDEADAGALAQL